ncbi:hypothetical protein PIB30_019031 [Stylosanthes scabra]|uniref:Uncharacterized protein n=1 Tax=Stylosanthes scabra TaxID=79078 RepID=A0ABU6S837_9FABA|nr:hypothetical protein [Stylosanthes scabra]
MVRASRSRKPCVNRSSRSKVMAAETNTRQSLKTENKPEDHGRLRRRLEDEDGKRTRRLEDFFELEDGDLGLGYDGAAEASEATTLRRRCTKGDGNGMRCGVAGWRR